MEAIIFGEANGFTETSGLLRLSGDEIAKILKRRSSRPDP
jgi:hypothetical protein